ncbi:hypothetical protein BV25DRAFT_1821211 [Artomyces pyxidatus]|uniref:Uncharacterized protein n=1 Tax=Artomyces pyxidatus TaxID=48021 RepID=A0ACB8TD99_9AGAM|nr:hypothetical protein BV25DRAFT_1821211 [Artomyces pyxidatus]
MPSSEEMSSAREYWSAAFYPRLSLLDDTQSNQMAREEFDAITVFFDSLKARVNAFAPITRLPDDMLIRIFGILRDMWRPEGRSLGWILATHTSRRWRNVALAHHSLWAEINNDVSSKWATEMLSRAKAAPLAFQLRCKKPRTLASSPFVERVSQTKRLSVAGAAFNVSLDLMNLIHPAPILEEFTVQVNGIAALPSPLFAGCVPRLRVLNLSNCSFLWAELPATSALTCLRVSSDHALGRAASDLAQQTGPQSGLPGFAPEGYDQLLQLLENNRHTLHTLVLTYCLPLRTADVAHYSAIELPRLALLELGGSLAQCEDFLHRVTIPPSAALVLSVSPNADSPVSADIEGVLRQVALHSHAGPPMRRLEIRAERQHVTSSSLSLNTIGIFGYRDSDVVPATAVRLVWIPEESEDPVPALLVVRDALHLSNVEELSVSLVSGFPWSARHWQLFFGGFKGVTSLSITGPAMASLREANEEPGAFLGTVDPRLLTSPGGAFFPKLVSLAISSPNISSDVEGGSFLTWLRSQRASGLESLKINNCRFSFKHARAIREIIPDAVVEPVGDDDVDLSVPPRPAAAFFVPSHLSLDPDMVHRVGILPIQPIVPWPGHFHP